MPSTKWTQIAERNDWGHIFYTYANEGLSPAGTNDTSKALVLTAGRSVEVRWPDGTSSMEKLASETACENVSDMGNSYTVASLRFFIRINHKGIKAEVPFNKLKFRPNTFKYKDTP